MLLSLKKGNKGGVEVENVITGTKQVSDEVLILNGRVATPPTHIVAKTPTGMYYNPVMVYADENKKELLGTANGVFFKSDGKTPVSLRSFDSVTDKRLIKLPTIISNAEKRGPTLCKREPTFYNLIASGENALKLADAPVGSSVYLAGEVRDCWVGKFSIKVLWVIDMQLIRKAGSQ